MFATLRCTQDSFSVERAGPVNLRLACNNCRSKKVRMETFSCVFLERAYRPSTSHGSFAQLLRVQMRCSGDQTGCQRCVARQLVCEYTEALYRKNAKRQRTTSEPSTADSTSERVREAPTEQPAPVTGQIIYGDSLHTEPRFWEVSISSSQPNGQLGSSYNGWSTTDAFSASDGALGKFSGPSFRPDPDLAPCVNAMDHIWNSITDTHGGCLGTEWDHVGGFEVLPELTVPDYLEADGSTLREPVIIPESEAVRQEKLPHTPSGTLDTPGSSKPFPTKDTPSTQSCQCILTALNLLELLQTEDYRTDAGTVDNVLQRNKDGLAQCLELATCKACMNISSFTLLLINVCQVAVASFEKALSAIETQQPATNGSRAVDHDPEDTPFPTHQQTRRPSSFMGLYEINTLERVCVFGALASLHLDNWNTFLMDLRGTLEHLRLDTQLAMSYDIDNRIRAQRQMCTKLLSNRSNA